MTAGLLAVSVRSREIELAECGECDDYDGDSAIVSAFARRVIADGPRDSQSSWPKQRSPNGLGRKHDFVRGSPGDHKPGLLYRSTGVALEKDEG
jgi:hypothetical protein